jgi:molecular chaperone GrpE (heat shock protein)
MTLQDRLRANALKNGGAADHYLHKIAHEAADNLDAADLKIAELQAENEALRKDAERMKAELEKCQQSQ